MEEKSSFKTRVSEEEGSNKLNRTNRKFGSEKGKLSSKALKMRFGNGLVREGVHKYLAACTDPL